MYQLDDIRGVAADMDIVEGRSGTRIAHLRSHETRATSLKAASPAPKLVSRVMQRNAGAICVCVPDEMMMSAALSFAGNVPPLSRLQRDR
jgi:L-serine/L-threonine ammonia-lyase